MTRYLIFAFSIVLSSNLHSKVDTLTFTVDKEFTTFKAFHYDCKQQVLDLGCLLNSKALCLKCKNPITEKDSILQNRKRGNDSLYINLLDKNGTLRIEFFRPDSEVFIGNVKLYDKRGRLMAIENYGTSFKGICNSNLVTVHQFPIRIGTWSYYNTENQITRTVEYEVLMDNQQSDFHVLVRERKFNTQNGHVKIQKEYTKTIDDLELGIKQVKFGKPFYKTRGKKL